ncbi:hypothetical protein RESH_03924 [Rhodopirellula europaea SH398]|uniref:Uncharacterized protein n=1 Tax=Rhodopirellula europaea SH398 TaxID=1263868 RepID=M5SGV7_9BACT|nr:hypothetical protein RESH_03924 [Rhodopirellula europaea SH398]
MIRKRVDWVVNEVLKQVGWALLPVRVDVGQEWPTYSKSDKPVSEAPVNSTAAPSGARFLARHVPLTFTLG